MTDDSDAARRSRLRWRSRRGLLELDLILQRFVAQELEQADAETLSVYEQLLLLPDPRLLALICPPPAASTVSRIATPAEMPEPHWRPLLCRLREMGALGTPQGQEAAG